MTPKRKSSNTNFGESTLCPFTDCRIFTKLSNIDFDVESIHKKIGCFKYLSRECMSKRQENFQSYIQECCNENSGSSTKKNKSSNCIFYVSKEENAVSESSENNLGTKKSKGQSKENEMIFSTVTPPFIEDHQGSHKSMDCMTGIKQIEEENASSYFSLKGKESYRCTFDNCKAGFEKIWDISKHLSCVHDAPVKCACEESDCSVNCDNFMKHIKNVHKKIKAQCAFCKKWLSDSKFTDHLKTCIGKSGRACLYPYKE